MDSYRIKNGVGILPKGIYRIENNAYRGRSDLGCKNSVIPDSVTEIGYRAFAGCKDLVHIDIPDSVKIVHDAFYGCPCEADFEKRYYEEELPF